MGCRGRINWLRLDLRLVDRLLNLCLRRVIECKRISISLKLRLRLGLKLLPDLRHPTSSSSSSAQAASAKDVPSASHSEASEKLLFLSCSEISLRNRGRRRALAERCRRNSGSSSSSRCRCSASVNGSGRRCGRSRSSRSILCAPQADDLNLADKGGLGGDGGGRAGSAVGQGGGEDGNPLAAFVHAEDSLVPTREGGVLIADNNLHEIVLVGVGLENLAEGARVLRLEPDRVLDADGVAYADGVALLRGDNVDDGERLGPPHHVFGKRDVDGESAGVCGVCELY